MVYHLSKDRADKNAILTRNSSLQPFLKEDKKELKCVLWEPNAKLLFELPPESAQVFQSKQQNVIQTACREHLATAYLAVRRDELPAEM